jgi:hypothetical protein
MQSLSMLRSCMVTKPNDMSSVPIPASVAAFLGSTQRGTQLLSLLLPAPSFRLRALVDIDSFPSIAAPLASCSRSAASKACCAPATCAAFRSRFLVLASASLRRSVSRFRCCLSKAAAAQRASASSTLAALI